MTLVVGVRASSSLTSTRTTHRSPSPRQAGGQPSSIGPPPLLNAYWSQRARSPSPFQRAQRPPARAVYSARAPSPAVMLPPPGLPSFANARNTAPRVSPRPFGDAYGAYQGGSAAGWVHAARTSASPALSPAPTTYLAQGRQTAQVSTFRDVGVVQGARPLSPFAQRMPGMYVNGSVPPERASSTFLDRKYESPVASLPPAPGIHVNGSVPPERASSTFLDRKHESPVAPLPPAPRPLIRSSVSVVSPGNRAQRSGQPYAHMDPHPGPSPRLQDEVIYVQMPASFSSSKHMMPAQAMAAAEAQRSLTPVMTSPVRNASLVHERDDVIVFSDYIHPKTQPQRQAPSPERAEFSSAWISPSAREPITTSSPKASVELASATPHNLESRLMLEVPRLGPVLNKQARRAVDTLPLVSLHQEACTHASASEADVPYAGNARLAQTDSAALPLSQERLKAAPDAAHSPEHAEHASNVMAKGADLDSYEEDLMQRIERTLAEASRTLQIHSKFKSMGENSEKVSHGVGPGTGPGAEGVVGISGQKDAEPNIFC